MTTRALFRVFKHGDFKGVVDAILFDVPANKYNFMIYTHFGQHGEGDYYGVMRQATRSATPAEYADLKAELEQIYEEPITVYRRIPADFKAWE